MSFDDEVRARIARNKQEQEQARIREQERRALVERCIEFLYGELRILADNLASHVSPEPERRFIAGYKYGFFGGRSPIYGDVLPAGFNVVGHWLLGLDGSVYEWNEHTGSVSFKNWVKDFRSPDSYGHWKTWMLGFKFEPPRNKMEGNPSDEGGRGHLIIARREQYQGYEMEELHVREVFAELAAQYLIKRGM